MVNYLDEPPSAIEMGKLVKMLGVKPADVLRAKEVKAAGLHLSGASDKEVIEAMVANPKIIERPIVVSGNKAVLGRPRRRLGDFVSWLTPKKITRRTFFGLSILAADMLVVEPSWLEVIEHDVKSSKTAQGVWMVTRSFRSPTLICVRSTLSTALS